MDAKTRLIKTDTLKETIMTIKTGRCLCGSVRYALSGEPLRVGLCHCADCRKVSGSVFSSFGIWPRDAFSHEGETKAFAGRSFCPQCGSRLFNLTDTEAEVHLGSLDEAPTDLTPSYELWIKRREHWLDPLPGREQFEEDRT